MKTETMALRIAEAVFTGLSFYFQRAARHYFIIASREGSRRDKSEDLPYDEFLPIAEPGTMVRTTSTPYIA